MFTRDAGHGIEIIGTSKYRTSNCPGRVLFCGIQCVSDENVSVRLLSGIIVAKLLMEYQWRPLAFSHFLCFLKLIVPNEMFSPKCSDGLI